jgi:hypothetical protein
MHVHAGNALAQARPGRGRFLGSDVGRRRDRDDHGRNSSLRVRLVRRGCPISTKGGEGGGRGAPDGRFYRAGARIERGGPIGSVFKSLNSRLNDVVDEFAVHRRVSVLPPEPLGQQIEWRSWEVSPLHSSVRNYCIIAQQRQKLLHHRTAAPETTASSHAQRCCTHRFRAVPARTRFSLQVAGVNRETQPLLEYIRAIPDPGPLAAHLERKSSSLEVCRRPQPRVTTHHLRSAPPAAPVEGGGTRRVRLVRGEGRGVSD